MKQVIIFDFWGTLVEQGVYSPFKQARRILDLEDMPYPLFVLKFERALMTRRFESLQEAFTHVCKEFEVEPLPGVVDELIGLWNKNWLLAQPYAEVIEVLLELKKEHTLVLVANTDNFSVDRVLDKFALRALFDSVRLSYAEGVLKTDPEFYHKLFEVCEVSPEKCVAVGDSVESDVAAAENAGVQAILIDRQNRRDFPNRIVNLKEMLQWK